MPVPLVIDSATPGMSDGRCDTKFQTGKPLFWSVRKAGVITPLPASPSTVNFESVHTRSCNGALKSAPYAPALEPVTKTSSGATKCSRANFSTVRALCQPFQCTLGENTDSESPKWMSPVQYDTKTMFQSLNGFAGLVMSPKPVVVLFGLSEPSGLTSWSNVPIVLQVAA